MEEAYDAVVQHAGLGRDLTHNPLTLLLPQIVRVTWAFSSGPIRRARR